MARTPYPDPEAEAEYQNVVSQSSKPSADTNIYSARPQASWGGRSDVEVNNPDLDNPDKYHEYRKREGEMEKARRRR